MGEVVIIRRHGLMEGDAVRSKVGGPLMLVAVSDPTIMAEVECIWIQNRRLRTMKFRPDKLVVVACGQPKPGGAA